MIAANVQKTVMDVVPVAADFVVDWMEGRGGFI